MGVSSLPTQDELYEFGGSMIFSVETLSIALNETRCCPGIWRGGAVQAPEGRDEESLLEVLVNNGPWIAHLREQAARVGHFVVVSSECDGDRLEILDPWEPGTA